MGDPGGGGTVSQTSSSNHDDNKNITDGGSNKKSSVASVSEIWSLSTAKPRTRPFLVIGFFSAFVSGCVYPAMAFFFGACATDRVYVYIFFVFVYSRTSISFMNYSKSI